MANEAVCLESWTETARYTVADAAAIPFGSLLKLADPHTVSLTSADNDPFAGIAITEKVANDGQTQITVAKNGVWDLKDSGAGITAGAIVNIGGANVIIASQAADLLTGSVVGKAEETAGAAEVIRVRVGRVV